MHSFSLLSLVATAAFSVCSTAAPIKVDSGLIARADARRDLENVNIVARTKKPSIPQILDGLIADLSPVVDQITALTGTGDVVATLNPILGQVVDTVGGAASNVDALLDSPVATILASVDSDAPVFVGDVAQLLVQVLTLLSNILGAALSLVGEDLSKLGPVISAFNEVVSKLVIALLGKVDDLLSAVLPLASGLIPTLTSLGLTTLGNVLNTLGGLLGLIL